MKLAVIGSRGFKNYRLMKSALIKYKIEEIISGGSKGADTLAEKFADEHKIKEIIFKPNYARYKREAPLMRNKQIVDYADKVIAFWDGESRGTKYTIDYARKRGKKIDVIHCEEK
ncbi:MAG: DUF2493 domain-containing protein [Candidatus Aerophobetes bacterium]|nr:DUF2493 domain-containing protein [Candidatus Aerophobetes bacterium]